MVTLRKTIQRQVLEILDGGIFTSEDFDVQFGVSENTPCLVSISFKHDDNFNFAIYPENNIGNFDVRVSPGEIHETEQNFYNFQEALELIDDWCHSIREELKATKPVFRELDNLRALIEEQLSTLVDESEEFTVPEINALKEKFSALEERVENLEKEKIITEKQLEEFKSGMQTINEGIEIYPKKTWLKTAANKLVKVIASIGKSQEGRKLLSDGARKLLGLD